MPERSATVDADKGRLQHDLAAVVIDIDGTLVDTSTEVSVDDRAAAGELLASDRALHLATGRNETSAARIAAQLPTTPPAILYNGARLVDLSTGEVHWEARLPADEHEALIRLLSSGDLPAEPVVYSDDGVLVRRRESPVRELLERDGTPAELIPDLSATSGRPAIKWLLITDPSEVSTLEARLSEAVPRLTTTRSEPGYVEVLPPDVDKGAALLRLCELQGYEPAHVAVAGDNPNDGPMLEHAGLPLAVQSADERLRDLALAVLPDPPNGSLRTIVTWILDDERGASGGRGGRASAHEQGAS
ncbi:HAD family phosphatase [Egibacter rhizosphaerae]|uniref:HAD family phosphatase n=1 Tax=Egibacter rhizosphaerae TaxID=1670831 RepID=A0A411YII1_9ACTN|nr:HAD family hydrolase [Egibacter rhizosphaerae]QBI20882.1 HAD family phosphatase [Egibacter rhizosphaerae]